MFLLIIKTLVLARKIFIIFEQSFQQKYSLLFYPNDYF
jgi:hypothetical protein